MNTKRERRVSKNIRLVGAKMSHQIVWDPHIDNQSLNIYSAECFFEFNT